jgi:hypothetical protein
VYNDLNLMEKKVRVMKETNSTREVAKMKSSVVICHQQVHPTRKECSLHPCFIQYQLSEVRADIGMKPVDECALGSATQDIYIKIKNKDSQTITSF